MKEKDKNLLGNKLIEDAIIEMYNKSTDVSLGKVLSIIRERIKDEGHFIVAVRPGNIGLELRPVVMQDDSKWFAAFTSFDEELKRKEEMVSGFTASISNLFEMALQTKEVEGVLLNPWDKAIRLNKEVLTLLLN